MESLSKNTFVFRESHMPHETKSGWLQIFFGLVEFHRASNAIVYEAPW